MGLLEFDGRAFISQNGRWVMISADTMQSELQGNLEHKFSPFVLI